MSWWSRRSAVTRRLRCGGSAWTSAIFLAALAKRGFIAGQKLVGRLLKRLNFGLQANRKTREGANHPDRNAQSEHVNATVKAFQAAGQPVISVDTKKRSLSETSRTAAASCGPRGSGSRSG